MPHISEFFGIVIKMFYNDQSPPHFHAEYGEYEAIYTIETIEVLRGELLNRFELKENWELARNGFPLNSVAPLE
jgi:hypothetical protein